MGGIMNPRCNSTSVIIGLSQLATLDVRSMYNHPDPRGCQSICREWCRTFLTEIDQEEAAKAPSPFLSNCVPQKIFRNSLRDRI